MPLLSWHQGVLYAPISIYMILCNSTIYEHPLLMCGNIKDPHLPYGQIEYSLFDRCNMQPRMLK